MTLAIDETDPDTLYGASFSQGGDIGGCGIWRTRDRGASWRQVGDSLPGLKVAALALRPGRSAPLYAATLDRGRGGGGLYRSDNRGDSWELVGDDDRLTGRHLLIDRTIPDRMFMPTGPAVLRSVDGGLSWDEVLDPGGGDVADLAMHPTTPSRIFASVVHDSNDAIAGIYESFDSGDNWTKLIGCPGGRLPAASGWRRIKLAVAASRKYVAFQSPDEYVVFHTTDLGCSVGGRLEDMWERGWSAGSDVAPSIFSFLYVHPADADIVYATGVAFRRSTDGGRSFSISKGPHVDHHALAVDPSDPDIIYTGCDGGVYRSNDRGASNSWTFVGEGMANTEFYDLAHARTDPDVIIGGTQDNGTIKRRPGTTEWDEIRGGDGATCDVHPTNEKILYSMGQYQDSIERQIDGGVWTPLSQALPGREDGSNYFNLHYHLHPARPTTMLASAGQLWRTPTTDPPGDWRPIFPPPGFPAVPGSVLRSAVDGRSDIYYAATSRGQLYAGVGGRDWELVFDIAGDCGSAAAMTTDVEVDPDDPDVVYVATDASAACRVVRLHRDNPAELAMSPQDITADLPTEVRILSLAIDRLRPGTLFVGTRTDGVYRGRQVGRLRWTWEPYVDGMPSAAGVVQLLAHPVTGVLRAGTMGRGAYEVDTDHPLGSVLAATGRVMFLRVHDTGGFGPPDDHLDGEAVFILDSDPRRAFGFELDPDAREGAHAGQLDLLRSAMVRRRRVRVEYVRTGRRNGRAIRVELLG